jgi:hypothetical protein
VRRKLEYLSAPGGDPRLYPARDHRARRGADGAGDRPSLVHIARDMTGATDVHLADEGRVAVHQLKTLQRDRAALLRHTRDAFLRWLFDTAGDQSPINPALFLATPGSNFAGAEISGTNYTKCSPT